MALSNSKPKLLQILIPLQLLSSIYITLFLIITANKVHSQDTVSFTYDYFDSRPANLTYQGDAHVPSGSSSLRLTATDSSGRPQRASVGRVLYSPTITFWEPGRQATFETIIKFFIMPVDSNPADGIAFFIAPVGSTIPPVSSGGNLGIFRKYGSETSIFAVEFDVFINGWDPMYRHIGIDINSRVSRNVTQSDKIYRQEVTARINYESTTRMISVTATSGSQTYTVNYVYDLKSVVTQQVQVGISASTGEQVAIHDILSWYYTSTLIWDGNSYQNNQDPHIHKYIV